jgi:8-oxo-dGTP diphosphatase
MEHRIRCAAIIIKDDSILLVKHEHPVSGAESWIPPGGGLKDGENIYDCAVRETFEETGLRVVLGSILYLREFVDTELHCHHFEIFILAKSFDGNLTIGNVDPNDRDYPYIKEVRFLSQEEMNKLTVYPEILKDEFWRDYASGNLQTKYLGQQIS